MLMTPEELLDKLMGKKRIPIMHDEICQLMLDSIRAAYAVAYMDAAATCKEWANEHTTNLYGKGELESVARCLEARANGTEIT